jgi:hypothetical protein
MMSSSDARLRLALTTYTVSIRHAASTIAHNLQSMYNGNQSGGELGKFPDPPYYWWLSGAAWGGMVDYNLYTGDDSYKNVTYTALVSQISGTYNYLPVAEALDEVRTGEVSFCLPLSQTIFARSPALMSNLRVTMMSHSGPLLP